MEIFNTNDFKVLGIQEIIPIITQKFKDKIIVIKFGGSAMTNDKFKLSVIRDISFLKKVGIHVVIVHGGGKAISEHMERVGLEPVFIDGQRKTDESTMEIAEMILCGKVNNEIVKLLNSEGATSVGLSGKDGDLVKAKKYYREKKNNGTCEKIDLGQVGKVVKINRKIIDILLNNKYIPVIAPIAVGNDKLDYNINADVLAGEIASELNADKLIFLTDVNGVFQNLDDSETLINSLNSFQAKMLLGNVINGGMLPKLETTIKALEDGVECAHIINGTMEHSLIKVFFDEFEIGTTIYSAEEETKMEVN